MNGFVARHAEKVVGVLSCFDRVIFKGYLPICRPEAMSALLGRRGLLLKDFKAFVTDQAQRVRAHAVALAQRQHRPFRYLNGRVRKEERVQQILRADPVTEGLVCVLAAVEPCQSFKLAYGQGCPQLVRAQRKCLCLYFYFLDRALGLMHVRLPTWFPFTVQVYVNGHDWLARKLDRHGLSYRRLDNAFAWLADPARTQRFADRFADLPGPRMLQSFAYRVCPLFHDVLAGLTYYWVTDQAEYATDVLFRDRPALKDLYDKLLRHATLCFGAEDVLGFLGRKLHGNFAGEVLTDCKRRWPGARVKHRMKENWIKMYDKSGLVLRIETVINHPYAFQVRRRGTRGGQPVTGWFPLTKGVAFLYRYAQVARAANGRYLQALSAVEDPQPAVQQLERLCRPVPCGPRRCRGLNPLRQDDAALFAAVMGGQYALQGFRNRDLAQHLLPRSCPDPAERRRRCARLTRRLQLLRAHGLIAKIPRSRRYRVTRAGCALMGAALYVRDQTYPEAFQKLAS